MVSLRPLQKAGFADVLDYGIFLFRKHFKSLLVINLIFNIPVMLVITILNPVFTEQYWNFINPLDITAINPDEIFSSAITFYAMLFGSLLLQVIYFVTLKNVMEGSIVKILYADVVLEQKKTVKQAVKECFRQFGTLFLGRMLYILIQGVVITVLYIILIAGMFAISFGLVGLIASTYNTPWLALALSSLLILIITVLVFFVLIAVGYYYGRFWMFLPAICIEQQKAGSSISRGGDLGRNGFYIIGLSFTFGYIMFLLFPTVISLVFNIVNTFSGNMDIELFRISTVVTQLFSEILRPLLTCIMTALYITLRVKREGLDIELNLWEIKQEEAEKNKRWFSEAPNAE